MNGIYATYRISIKKELRIRVISFDENSKTELLEEKCISCLGSIPLTISQAETIFKNKHPQLQK